MKKFLLLVVITITAAFSSLASRSNAPLTENELKAAITLINAELPVVVDEGLVWVSATYNGSNVVFTFQFDESDITASQLETIKPQLKEMMLAMFAYDADSREMLEMLTALNKGLTLNFEGAQSSKKVSITATSSEIKNLLK